MDLVVWTGPVAQFQVVGATVPGAKELFITCTGDGQPNCPAIGSQLQSAPSALWQKAGVEPTDLFLGAFSAGGSIVKRLMLNPDYRAATRAVLLSDATYTSSWVDAQAHIPPFIEGYVLYAMDVIADPSKLFVATASPVPNKTWASGVENLQAIRAEIEKRSGQSFVELDHFFGITPGPDHAYRLGNVIFAEYPLEPIGHGHNQIAPQVWQKILWPHLDGALPPGPGGEPPGPGPGPTPGPVVASESRGWGLGDWLALAAGGVAGYALVQAVRMVARR